MEQDKPTLLVLVDKNDVDCVGVLADRRSSAQMGSVFQIGDVGELVEKISQSGEKVVLIDRRIAADKLDEILDSTPAHLDDCQVVVLGCGDEDLIQLNSRPLTNVEIAFASPSAASIEFYAAKAMGQLAYLREVRRESNVRIQDMKGDLQSLEAKVFDSFTLDKLSKSMLSMQTLPDIAGVLLAAARESTGAQVAALFVINRTSERYELIASRGLDEASVSDLHFVRDEGLFWQVLNGAEPFSIRNADGSYRFNLAVEKWHLDQLDSHTWFPLTAKNQLLGVMAIGAPKGKGTYAEVELGFIHQLANQAAIALESVLSDLEKTKAREDLNRKVMSLSVLYDVSQALNFANDLKKTLLLILDKAKESVVAQKGSIMLLDKKTDMLEVSVVRGIDPFEEARINSGQLACTRLKIGEGIAGKVAETKQPYILNETKGSAEFKQSDRSNVDSIICMPLIANDEIIGVMNITNKTTGEPFGSEDIEFLSTLSGQAAITIYNAQLYNLAITDGMTKLYIRRYFEQKLEEEFSRARRYRRPLTVVMSDIDKFKTFNDTYGHQQGDAVLIDAARIFRSGVRDVDLPCRYGGEEFVLVLPETNIDQAKVVAERLRRAVAEFDFPAEKEPLKVTVSLGIASFPEHASTPEALIKAADTAMYASKQAGRNRVTQYTKDLSMRPD